MSENHDTAHPIRLAEEIVAIVGGTDDFTAHAALRIAATLLEHRKSAEIEFERQHPISNCLSE